jgi:hypothetical protein
MPTPSAFLLLAIHVSSSDISYSFAGFSLQKMTLIMYYNICRYKFCEVILMRKTTSSILSFILFAMLLYTQTVEAANKDTVSGLLSIESGPLPSPIITENSVEVCLNSRYSQHSLSGTANAQQISNILWAAGKVPFTGNYRDIYLALPTATYLYDPNGHSLSWYSNNVRDDGAFAIIYESQLDFDTGVSFMPALLASVSLWNSTESPVASCPKGIGYPKARLIFGVQSVTGLTTELVVHSSVPEGEPGWLPDPCTAGDNGLEEVLTDLNYVSDFTQTNLTPRQISQILWAGYGCSEHTASGKAGLTVPSAWANYYLTQSIYLANEDGVFRYHNRNPDTNMAGRDHRIEHIDSSSAGRGGIRPADSRGRLQSAVSGLPQAPCYVILCLDSSYVGEEYARLEVGFVAGNILIQATAIDLGCYFNAGLTSTEQAGIQAATNIPSSHTPQAIVSIGPIETIVSISVARQGDSLPDAGRIVPLTIKFFTPGADVLTDTSVYEFISIKKPDTDNMIVYEVKGIEPGTYDIIVFGEHTLINVKRNVTISSLYSSIEMGTLLEGDANHDNIINIKDYAILSNSWLTSQSQIRYDSTVDFDRNGMIDTADLYLLTSNWLGRSPVEITP